MSLTLLLDLDDTLLNNEIDTFLPQYIAAFSRELAAYIDPDRFVEALMAGTRAMIANQRPDCTLKEIFEETFFPLLGLVPDDFQELSEHFYSQVFPTLRESTSPRPEAVKLVDRALARGYRVVVATNPLFPLTAIDQRLSWAELPLKQYDFELVTSYESFHFVKPNPAYYAEILARVGWPRGPIVMVGDDLERDILASNRMGLQAFWLTDNGSEAFDDPQAPLLSGKLEDVLPWIDQSPTEELSPDYSEPAAIVSTLKATAAALDSMCRKIPADVGAQRPAVDQWSISEILCHLRDVDREVNLPRVKKVLIEEDAFISGVDTDPWAEQRGYILENSSHALQGFIQTRIEFVELLESMKPVDWRRTFRHAIFGPTHLQELLNIAASHDRLHIRQVREVLDSFSEVY